MLNLYEDKLQLRTAKVPHIFRLTHGDMTITSEIISKLFDKTNSLPAHTELDFHKFIKTLDIYKTYETEFKCKLQQVYDSPHVQLLLDKNRLLLEFKTIDFFSKISSLKYHCYLHTGKDTTEAFLNDPLVAALSTERILYISKYNSYARAFRPLYNDYMQTEAKEIFKRLTLKNKIKYFFWKRNSGYVFEEPNIWSYLSNVAADEREPKRFFVHETNPYDIRNKIEGEIKDYNDDNNLKLLRGYFQRKFEDLVKK